MRSIRVKRCQGDREEGSTVACHRIGTATFASCR